METMNKPVAMVDEWQTHLKFNGRKPRTLAELATAQEEYRHAARMAEIRTMAPKLAKLDELLPAINEAAGFKVHNCDMTPMDKGKSIRIQSPMFSEDFRLHAALLAVGFSEIGRKPWGLGQALATMKHGRSLLVCVDVRWTEGGGKP